MKHARKNRIKSDNIWNIETHKIEVITSTIRNAYEILIKVGGGELLNNRNAKKRKTL